MGEWRSVQLTNLMLALIVGVMVFTMGLKSFLMVFVPVMLMASASGAWFFYVQHQFEDAYWRQSDPWDFYQAGAYEAVHTMHDPGSYSGSPLTLAFIIFSI